MKNCNQNNNDVILYKILRPVIKGLFFFFYHPKIEGKENIINNKLILAGNHTSILDCLMLISSTKRNIHFLAKQELWKGPKKILFNHMGLIPVNRQTTNHQSLKIAINYLNNDKLVGIFPEGTTEKGRGILPFKMGVIKMAKETGSFIVPFTISGQYRPFINNLKIVFHKPYRISTNNFEQELQKLKKIVTQ